MNKKYYLLVTMWANAGLAQSSTGLDNQSMTITEQKIMHQDSLTGSESSEINDENTIKSYEKNCANSFFADAKKNLGSLIKPYGDEIYNWISILSTDKLQDYSKLFEQAYKYHERTAVDSFIGRLEGMFQHYTRFNAMLADMIKDFEPMPGNECIRVVSKKQTERLIEILSAYMLSNNKDEIKKNMKAKIEAYPKSDFFIYLNHPLNIINNPFHVIPCYMIIKASSHKIPIVISILELNGKLIWHKCDIG